MIHRRDLVTDAANRETQALAAKGLWCVVRDVDEEPLAFWRDEAAVRQLARAIQPDDGAWRALVVRGGRPTPRAQPQTPTPRRPVRATSLRLR